MKNFKVTIGLEIHAELKTKTKMFCSCKNNPEEKKPNINICPVCMAHPGTLPVINKMALKNVLKVGVALAGDIADFTEFDRKNYFYPDIPKGYQISQYKYPLVSGGKLNGIKITRIHLEEDTARSTHDEQGHSLVDFNRAGIPLMELVTEPVIESAHQASDFAKELQLLLRYLEVSDANMEKGEMRIEANISVSETEIFGTKVEIKNLNSFKVVEKAIDYEINRQISTLEKGEKIIQETRGWDEIKQQTFSQRLKEGSKDYRYFPDPDLPKLKLSAIPEFNPNNLKKELPELPWIKRERLIQNYSIKKEDAEMYVSDFFAGDFFEKTASLLAEKEMIKTASNYIISDIVGLKKNNPVMESFGKIDHKNFSILIQMIHTNQISSRGAKDILKIMFFEGGNPKTIAEKNNLIQQNNEDDLKKIISKIIESNQSAVLEYKNGKENILGFLIGIAMKETKGSANPIILGQLFKEMI